MGGREGKGGCKLGEKVRRAINKQHPEKEMSVCGSSDTPAPEIERKTVRTVVIWGVKSTGIEVRTAVGEIPSECGGSKCGCHAAGVVFGNAIAAGLT